MEFAVPIDHCKKRDKYPSLAGELKKDNGTITVIPIIVAALGKVIKRRRTEYQRKN